MQPTATRGNSLPQRPKKSSTAPATDPMPRQPIRCHDSDRMTIPAAEAATAISNLQQSASILMAHESRPPRPREISTSHCDFGNESRNPAGVAWKPARLIAPDIIWAPFSLCDKAGNRFDAPRPPVLAKNRNNLNCPINHQRNLQTSLLPPWGP